MFCKKILGNSLYVRSLKNAFCEKQVHDIYLTSTTIYTVLLCVNIFNFGWKLEKLFNVILFYLNIVYVSVTWEIHCS